MRKRDRESVRGSKQGDASVLPLRECGSSGSRRWSSTIPLASSVVCHGLRLFCILAKRRVHSPDGINIRLPRVDYETRSQHARCEWVHGCERESKRLRPSVQSTERKYVLGDCDVCNFAELASLAFDQTLISLSLTLRVCTTIAPENHRMERKPAQHARHFPRLHLQECYLPFAHSCSSQVSGADKTMQCKKTKCQSR